MATLTIRNVPERVHQALRRRAAENSRSVEAEVRALLEAMAVRQPLGDVESGGALAHRGEVAEDAAPFHAEAGRPSAIGMWGRSPRGKSEVDRLIAQRRVEAAYEGDEITAEEYGDLNRRIDSWDVDAGWIERFLAQRRGEV